MAAYWPSAEWPFDRMKRSRIWPVGLAGADAQDAAVQRGQDVGGREGPAHVADLALRDGTDDRHTDAPGH